MDLLVVSVIDNQTDHIDACWDQSDRGQHAPSGYAVDTMVNCTNAVPLCSSVDRNCPIVSRQCFFHGKNLIFCGHIYFLVEYHRLHHPIALVEVISNINHKIEALYTSEVLLLLSLIIILSYSSGKTYHIHHVTI